MEKSEGPDRTFERNCAQEGKREKKRTIGRPTNRKRGGDTKYGLTETRTWK